MYKAWIDPEALTACDGFSDFIEDSADSLFIEGSKQLVVYDNPVQNGKYFSL